MRKLFKKLLPPFFFDIWHFVKRIVFRYSKPRWFIVKSGPLKNFELFANDRNEYFAQMRNGTYDGYIYKSINDIDLNGKTVLDIGCHIGYHSFCFSQLVGEKGKVFAIDPNPFNLDRLKIIGKKNSLMNNIEICDVGISETIGEIDFNFSSNVDDMTSSGGYIDGTITPLADSIYLDAGFVKKKVKVTTLDQFVYKYEIEDLSIIKIDVEGHEANVLKGGVETFKKKSPVVLIEIHTVKAMYDSDQIMKDSGYDSDLIHHEEDGRVFLKYYKRDC